MADDEDTRNDVNEESDPSDYDEADDMEVATTTIPVEVLEDLENGSSSLSPEVHYDDVEDEDLPEYTVHLYINDSPGNESLPNHLINAGLTDIYGNPIVSSTPWIDAVNGYTQDISRDIYNELNGNATDIRSRKGWWGEWSWEKIVLVGLIGLCIIGILLSILFLLIGKKFKTNTTTPPPTKRITIKGPALQTKYQPVDNV